MGFNYKSVADSLSADSASQNKSVFDSAMGHINKSHINATSPVDIYSNKKNSGHNINPAVRTHMQQDIMRNGITKDNRAVARMIDGNSGIYNTMVNQGMGDVADRQIEYQETSAQFGTATFTHMFNDSAIKNTSDRGNGLMMDELTVDSQSIKTNGGLSSGQTSSLSGFGDYDKNSTFDTKSNKTKTFMKSENQSAARGESFGKKSQFADKMPSAPLAKKEARRLDKRSGEKKKIIEKYSKLKQNQKKEVMKKIIEKQKNAKSFEEKEYYNKMLRIIKQK